MNLWAKKVDEVDQKRIKYARDLLVKSGVDDADAETRAKLLYWASIGRLMMPTPNLHSFSQQEVSRLTDHLLSS